MRAMVSRAASDFARAKAAKLCLAFRIGSYFAMWGIFTLVVIATRNYPIYMVYGIARTVCQEPPLCFALKSRHSFIGEIPRSKLL